MRSSDDLHRFWFGAGGRARLEWFNKNPDFDRDVIERFAGRLDRDVRAEPSSAWHRLDLILLFDQVPRHVYRNDPRCFSYDHRALQLAKERTLIDNLDPFDVYEAYFYMLPLEHSEVLADRHAFVAFIEILALGCDSTSRAFVTRAYDYATRHKSIIERFGRFPHRNDLLGRASTDAEIAFLRQPGSGF